MTAPSSVPVPAADASQFLADIHLVARHISTVGTLLMSNDETLCVGDLIHDLSMRLLRDLDSYSSQSSN